MLACAMVKDFEVLPINDWADHAQLIVKIHYLMHRRLSILESHISRISCGMRETVMHTWMYFYAKLWNPRKLQKKNRQHSMDQLMGRTLEALRLILMDLASKMAPQMPVLVQAYIWAQIINLILLSESLGTRLITEANY
jgi:hypothetical protein